MTTQSIIDGLMEEIIMLDELREIDPSVQTKIEKIKAQIRALDPDFYAHWFKV